ncbi:interleukin-6 [Ochotona curzoniae]|uniref:interleukin-6 n=1 Tax=Ochotona curzoniae TaxID=130825 RepID=UPI001B347E1E|nr:interleukin-6 [Ochotona curzoniae]
MCNYDADCLDCKQVLSDVNLTLPQLTERDGCFPSAPNQEICLMRITAGLLEFEIYLKHLQNKFKSDEENNNMDIVLQNSQTLVKNLRPKVNTTEEAPTLEPATLTSLKENMQLKEQWRRTQTIHYILCGLKDFLEFTLRAVRLM